MKLAIRPLTTLLMGGIYLLSFFIPIPYAPFLISLFALVCSFALVWHIWWMAAFGLVASVVAFVVRSYDEDTDYFVPAQEVARIETARLKDLAEA